MVSSTLVAVSLLSATVLAGSPLIKPGNDVAAPLAVRVASSTMTQCNQNNCLRVMLNTPAVASPFCSSYLQPTSYTTVTPTVTISGTNTISSSIPSSSSAIIPAHISEQCALSTATITPLATRLSSACSCLSVSPSAGTVTSTVYAPATTTTVATSSAFDCQSDSLPSNTYTVNGETFDLTCNVYYFVKNGDDIIYGQDYITTCINSCAAISGCIGVSWVDFGVSDPANECGILYDIAAGQGTGAFASALLDGYSGAVGEVKA